MEDEIGPETSAYNTLVPHLTTVRRRNSQATMKIVGIYAMSAQGILEVKKLPRVGLFAP